MLEGAELVFGETVVDQVKPPPLVDLSISNPPSSLALSVQLILAVLQEVAVIAQFVGTVGAVAA